ncbi:hypothetical protein MTP99_018854 [Tenebrio molitor]|nr:hypothetical protein MTP99_018854 [Tenebrio molitor]
MSEANPKNVLAIEEQDLPRLEDKNVPKNADEISPEPKANAEGDDAELKNNEIKKDRQGLPRVEDEEHDRNESEWKILKLPNDYEIDFSHDIQ